MGRNILIEVEYDGSNYSGWQIQKNTEHTIQQILQEKIGVINKAPVKIIGAGRTDAGVHALGQAVNFNINVAIPVDRIPVAINRLLPSDIICKSAREVNENFHARYDARGKLYRYRILNKKYSSVFIRNYIFHVPYELDLEKMVKAVQYLKGQHDFTSFQSSGSKIKDTVRTINKIELFNKNQEIWLEVAGDGFLYNMVRIITGTLIEVGTGRIKPTKLKNIINARDRNLAGFTAPASGLTLVKVYYN